jgi:DNA (cytosine-5)-methyltransferase 1
MKAISLFSGMGGDTLGMHNAGVEVVAFSEKDSVSISTHQENFKACRLLKSACDAPDISKIEDIVFDEYRGKVDIVFAGFPCQSFSSAGKRMENDPRSDLFRQFVRVTSVVQPLYVIGENVKGLLSKRDGSRMYIDVIVEEFEKIGYSVCYKVLKLDEYGVPQNRQRVFIVGVRTYRFTNFDFGIIRKSECGDLRSIIFFSMQGSMSAEGVFDMDSIPVECILSDMDNDEPASNAHPYLLAKASALDKTYNGKTFTTLFSFGKRKSPIHCEIVDIRKPCKTIICTYEHQPRLVVPVRNKIGYYLRCLLVDELKQIQGFPADYVVCGSSKQQTVQIGNAVPPPIVTRIIDVLPK